VTGRQAAASEHFHAEPQRGRLSRDLGLVVVLTVAGVVVGHRAAELLQQRDSLVRQVGHLLGGELLLRDIFSVLPHDIMIELEIPRRSLALAGIAPIDRLRPCVDAAPDLLSEVSTARPPKDGRENTRRC
jgi:hypothetical protein